MSEEADEQAMVDVPALNVRPVDTAVHGVVPPRVIVEEPSVNERVTVPMQLN